MKFHYKNTALLSEEKITKTAESLQEYITHLNDVASSESYDADEASINLPFDEEMIATVKQLAEEKTSDQLKYIVVVGIGGSNLGTKAIYDALLGFYDTLEPTRFPKIIFLDTQDDGVLSKLKNLIGMLQSKEEILVNAISKSGGTTETAANLEVVYKTLSEKFGDANDRIVITTNKDSKMQQAAQKKDISVLNIPKKVGGRYSVFSAVGLFPLAAIGVDIDALKKGAQEMRRQCLANDMTKNPAALSAAILYLQNKNEININDNFFFLPQLESLGKWYRQLMGESVGKDGKGITPTVSIGSTDLHSVGQLYLGGPKDKITTFIYSERSANDVSVPQNTSFELVDSIPGKRIRAIMNAIVKGTTTAYKKQFLPFMEIVFDDVSAHAIGEFMQFKMIEMMYLGKLLGVNSFNQPHVELYKVETKTILSK